MKPFLSILFFVILSFSGTAQTTKYRCGAETTKGTPCKMIVKSAGAKCHHHGGNHNPDGTSVHLCGATTSKGAPCRNKVRTAGTKCHHHQ